MNLVQYYWNVSSNRFGHFRKSGHYAFDGAVFSTAPSARLDRARPVIVHLDHPLMHVGDQIFFRPLIWRLKQAGDPKLSFKASGTYAQFRLLAAYFLEQEHWSVDQLLASRMTLQEAEARMASGMAGR